MEALYNLVQMTIRHPLRKLHLTTMVAQFNQAQLIFHNLPKHHQTITECQHSLVRRTISSQPRRQTMEAPFNLVRTTTNYLHRLHRIITDQRSSQAQPMAIRPRSNPVQTFIRDLNSNPAQ